MGGDRLETVVAIMSISIAAPDIGTAEQESVHEVLESAHLAHGDVVTAFEDEFGDYVGSKEAVATSNGTTALHTALEAVGLEPGSKVVTTPFSFVATANAIRFAGGVPEFADIDPRTFNLDARSVEETVRSNPDEFGAILVVHLYGLSAEMDHLREIAETYDLSLIEDAAQAHGARYKRQHVGSLGDVGCFSFYPTKNMTTGEGGMITTDRVDVAERSRRFIDHGRGSRTYEHIELGHNFRMTNIAAAIGRAQLEKLPEFVAARRSNGQSMTEGLAEEEVRTPFEPDHIDHAYHQYTVRTDRRDELNAFMDHRGIDCRVYYPHCIHDLEAYRRFSITTPNAERAADEVLSLPVHPKLTEEDLQSIVGAVREFSADRGR